MILEMKIILEVVRMRKRLLEIDLCKEKSFKKIIRVDGKWEKCFGENEICRKVGEENLICV